MLRETIWIVALTASWLTPAGPVRAKADANSVSGASVFGRLQLHKLAPYVHVARQPDRLWATSVGNVTLIEQSDGFVLIDAGGLANGGDIVSFVESLGTKPVKAIAVTHWHGDHHFGLAPVVKAWPTARIISTARTKELIYSAATRYVPLRPDPAAEAERSKNLAQGLAEYKAEAANPKRNEDERKEYAFEAALLQDLMKFTAGAHIVPPTETFTNKLLLDDATTPVELQFLGRGNTEGDAIAWLPKQRILVTGDLVVAPAPYAFNVSPRSWMNTLGRLKQFDFKILVPGHGAPQKDKVYVDRLITAIHVVRTWVNDRAAQGLSMNETLKQATFEEQTALFVGNGAWGKQIFEGYFLAPLVVAAYKEAKKEPIIEGE